MDTLLQNINGVIDPGAKNNISHTLDNLNRMTSSLVYTSASLQELLNTQTGALAKTLNNLNAVTGNLAGNNEKINSVFSNLDKTTTKLSQLELQKTLNTLDATVNDLNRIVARVGSDSGTLGKFINDTKLYENLASTGNKLNLLIDDIRVNPKRYVSISVFGKKQTNPPLAVPTPDTLHSPYYIRKAND